MFRLANLNDLLRLAAILAVVAVWLWRYPPWRRRAPAAPSTPSAGEEVGLVWRQVEEIADRYYQTQLRREHLLWAILTAPGAQLDELLRQLPLDRLPARARVAAVISGFPEQFLGRIYHQRLWLDQPLQQTLSQARREAEQAHAQEIAPLHVLLALLDPDPALAAAEPGPAQQLLAELGLTRAALARAAFALDQDAATKAGDIPAA